MLATVAVLAVGAVALWNQQSDRNGMPDWQRQSLAMVGEIDAGAIRLDHFSNDLGEIKGMLVKHGRPVPAGLPRGVEAMTSLGCKTFQVGAREATAHLVVMNNEKGSLPGAPPERRPEFVERDGWNVARWSDGGQCYFIATRASRSALERLFAVLVLR